MLRLNNNNWQYPGNKVCLGSVEYPNKFSFFVLFRHWMQWRKANFIGPKVKNINGHITAKVSSLHNLKISYGMAILTFTNSIFSQLGQNYLGFGPNVNPTQQTAIENFV